MKRILAGAFPETAYQNNTCHVEKNLFASRCRIMRYNGAERIKAIIDAGERRQSERC